MISIASFQDFTLPDKPVRKSHYTLIWCSKGTADIVIDDKQFAIKQHHVVTITSGQVYYFKNGSKAKGFILEFSFSFFCRNDNDMELIFHNGLFCHFDLNEVIAINDHQVIEDQLILIKKELKEKPYQHLISVRSRIELILVAINRAKVSNGDEIYKPDALFLKFLEMVRANFAADYSAAQIAAMLGTTEARLNEQSKLHTGKTAQNVIYGLIISEAKRLLLYQDIPIKEIAYSLGFNDPFYFSNFFKKHAGQSPKSYKSTVAV